MFSLRNKIAIVTGASQGIGKTTAQLFSKSGAHVVCIARNEEKIKNLANTISKNGHSASYNSCDISDGDLFQDTIKSVINDYGKIDILINNAGITRDSLVLRMKNHQWDEVLNTNLKGAFYATKSVLRSMMKNKYGRIINITSIVGLQGNSGQSNYSASKAGLIGFSQSVAKEVASRGITINCIAPGWIETEMTSDLPQDIKSEIIKSIPIGKTGTTEDIAYTALFLASKESKYITGQTITVDGGRVIN
ncbi:MAG: 3-oxoacyl-[acyl-carrier-protein] reductase [Candidatus Marinimicrobia bacterium]|nr:3-oxoacyl-[acyl-carrier-protein] reductase [Candidatus Neomarinimicrobiota bacterium]